MRPDSKYRSHNKVKKTKIKIHRTILLICEGKETEDKYFRSFKYDVKKSNITIKGGFSDPKQLVDEAILLLN